MKETSNKRFMLLFLSGILIFVLGLSYFRIFQGGKKVMPKPEVPEEKSLESVFERVGGGDGTLFEVTGGGVAKRISGSTDTLSEEFKERMPIFPDSLVDTVTEFTNSNRETASFVTQGSVADVYNFYKGVVEADGWNIDTDSLSEDNAILGGKKEDVGFMVIINRQQGATLYTVDKGGTEEEVLGIIFGNDEE